MGLWQNMLDILGVSSKKVSDCTPASLVIAPSFLQVVWIDCKLLYSIQVCVLVVGLDNSGKSTVVNCLKVPKDRGLACL